MSVLFHFFIKPHHCESAKSQKTQKQKRSKSQTLLNSFSLSLPHHVLNHNLQVLCICKENPKPISFHPSEFEISPSMAPRKLLDFWVLIFFLIAFFISRGFAENVNFYFPYFNFRNLTFLGDSHIQNGVVGLTRELIVPSSIANVKRHLQTPKLKTQALHFPEKIPILKLSWKIPESNQAKPT
ncbi:hypothetical protein C1H46_041968 [Malus baccata]|uniref:Uncharacterized protein n=1 Tax=Malus baccata TaxID=106549 RepID=A0A540KE35_MALBA|nr:hypothetical protein C1H46_041968 [Malus baccata]